MLKANFWKNNSNAKSNKVVEIHHLNLYFIQVADFEQIKFRSVLLASSCNSLEERINIRKPNFSLCLAKQDLSIPNLIEFAIDISISQYYQILL